MILLSLLYLSENIFLMLFSWFMTLCQENYLGHCESSFLSLFSFPEKFDWKEKTIIRWIPWTRYPILIEMCHFIKIYCHSVGCWCFFNKELTDVTDVCMDESAVSSDPVIAFLLDEVVVKDWCKRTFRNIAKELQRICILKILKIFGYIKPCFFPFLSMCVLSIMSGCALNIFH